MNRNELYEEILNKRSFLCVGLDTDIEKIPKHLFAHEDPVYEFNQRIIETTHPLCVAYKLNTAFYEAQGEKGLSAMRKTLAAIPEECLTIADAKRSDIGNSAEQYAKAFFETYNFDAITVNPYMGKDSVQPFLNHNGKWTIVLALTSNSGAEDFQLISNSNKHLFETVLAKACQWGTEDNMMFVVGATRPELISRARQITPHHFFLIPGVGAQGGSLEEVATHGMNENCGILVNISRDIIYAGNDEDFADNAREAALSFKNIMAGFLHLR